MTAKNWSLLGAALLVAGLFTPILTAPMLGSVNLFNNGSNLLGLALVVLAVIAASLAAKDRVREAIFPGAAAAAILLYLFGSLQYRLAQFRAVASATDNPLSRLEQVAIGAVQLQWGWLVLAAGTGLIIFAATSARKLAEADGASEADETVGLFSLPDGIARLVAGASAVLVVGSIAWDALPRAGIFSAPQAVAGDTPRDNTNVENGARSLDSGTASSGPNAEEAAYISQHLQLYDLDARYFDSVLDGRIPGVRFKIRNTGSRTLNSVKVRVVFRDANGSAIAEEDYYPVLVSQYSVGDNSGPLRPGYIWQQDSSRFLTARNVPSEWAPGRATATITEIEFGPNE